MAVNPVRANAPAAANAVQFRCVVRMVVLPSARVNVPDLSGLTTIEAYPAVLKSPDDKG
jgi:hypothetical protein